MSFILNDDTPRDPTVKEFSFFLVAKAHRLGVGLEEEARVPFGKVTFSLDAIKELGETFHIDAAESIREALKHSLAEELPKVVDALWSKLCLGHFDPKKEAPVKVVVSELPVGKPNANGRVYTEKAIVQAIGAFQESIRLRTALVFAPSGDERPSLKDTVGAVKALSWEEGCAKIEVEPLKRSEHADLIKHLADGSFGVFPQGVGLVGPGGVIEDFKITGFSIGPKAKAVQEHPERNEP